MSKTKINKKEKTKRKKTSVKGIKKAVVAVYLLIVIVGGYYIYGVNDLSVKGFALYESKGRLAELKESQNDLESKVVELNTYSNIVKRTENMNLVKVDKVDYITLSGAVAVSPAP